jgi:hypothetical protein
MPPEADKWRAWRVLCNHNMTCVDRLWNSVVAPSAPTQFDIRYKIIKTAPKDGTRQTLRRATAMTSVHFVQRPP